MISYIPRRIPSSRENTHETVHNLAVVVFTLVASMHVLRILMGWEVRIGGAVIPMWASYVGLVIAGCLAVMPGRESGQSNI